MIQEIPQALARVEAFANGGRVYLADSLDSGRWVRFDDPASVRDLIAALQEACGQAFPPRTKDTEDAAD